MLEELIKALVAAGGVGGLLAAVTLFFYRKENQTHERRQLDHIRVLEKINDRLLEVIEGNTQAMSHMTEAVEALQKTVADMTIVERERETFFRNVVMPTLLSRKS